MYWCYVQRPICRFRIPAFQSHDVGKVDSRHYQCCFVSIVDWEKFETSLLRTDVNTFYEIVKEKWWPLIKTVSGLQHVFAWLWNYANYSQFKTLVNGHFTSKPSFPHNPLCLVFVGSIKMWENMRTFVRSCYLFSTKYNECLVVFVVWIMTMFRVTTVAAIYSVCGWKFWRKKIHKSKVTVVTVILPQ